MGMEIFDFVLFLLYMKIVNVNYFLVFGQGVENIKDLCLFLL